MEDVGFKNATFSEIDHSVVYEHDHRGSGAATEEGLGERCINETSLITGAVIFLIAQVLVQYASRWRDVTLLCFLCLFIFLCWFLKC